MRSLQARELQIAAEYLVMAAWLAYLKSQLLLPPAERELGDAEAMAEDLEERLRRLEALRRAAAALQARPRLGSERFARGAPERQRRGAGPLWTRGLGRAVRRLWRADAAGAHVADDHAGAPADDAGGGDAAVGAASCRAGLARAARASCRRVLGDPLQHRSAVAASLIASLELARQGEIELRQAAPFAPIMVRRRA